MGPNKATILIKKAALEFDKNINAELEEYDLTHSQYRVMKYLYRNEGQGVRIVDLERFFSMSHPTAIGIVQNLEKKGLVSLDYDKPLKGFDESAYAPWPIRGSMALTDRGQKVLEMMEYQGISEE